MKYILLPVLLLSVAFASNQTEVYSFNVPQGSTCHQTRVCDKTTCRYVAECDIPVIVR